MLTEVMVTDTMGIMAITDMPTVTHTAGLTQICITDTGAIPARGIAPVGPKQLLGHAWA